jgi:hypothetical protein
VVGPEDPLVKESMTFLNDKKNWCISVIGPSKIGAGGSKILLKNFS